MSTVRRAALALLGAALATALLAVPAVAHVTIVPAEADSASFRIDLRVGHGCAGSPTTAVRVRVPDGVEGVRPAVAPGWEIQLVRDADEAAAARAAAAGPVVEVAWVGGSLPDEHLQEFGLSGRFTDEAPDVVHFPVVQECAEGEHRWIDVPASLEEWGELEEPAPYVELAFRRDGEPEATPPEAGADTTSGDFPGEAGDPETDGEATDGPGGVDPLALAGLVAGLLGLAAGGLALLRTGRG